MVRRKRTGKKANQSKDKPSKTVVLVDKSKRKNRHYHILQEVKQLQQTTQMLIPRAPFARLVREIIFDLFPRYDNLRLQLIALEALQEAAEAYLVQFFEDAVLLCLHGKRVTLMQKDMILLRRLRGRDDIINK